ncbi:hypothetical protein [Falsirhodobacter xinxiangensis]|uniref:hypothetical protein n=1 Tax=Falsirhodobacter xinxiangensis TaxID=2530049 RepID=UPI0010A9EE8A|nr:hypothetical protein [Rhodobacter xinxiangensis]
MPLVGNGIVAIWNDILPETRDSFFEWHPREHMQERMGVPGFLRGRRYIAVDGGIEFLTLYEAVEPELLTSEAYRQRLANPTEWSLSVLPSFRSNLRGVCRIVESHGYADGGFMLTVRFTAGPDSDAGISAAIADLVEQPRIVGVHFIRCDKDLSGGNQSLQRGRTISVPDCVLMIEASTREELAELVDAIESRMPSECESAIYRLEYQVMNYAKAAE